MAMPNKLNGTLQENLITLLCYNEKEGKIVANMLEPNTMEGDYRLVAERAVDYWNTYKRPPVDHSADLFADIIEDKHNRRAASIKRILTAMVHLSENVNAEYVMNQLRTFQRMQRIKDAIIKSAEKINSESHLAIEEIEEMWQNLLRTQEKDFSFGTYLYEVDKIMDWAEKKGGEFRFGIEEFDRRGIVPIRGTMLILLAPAGRGKTWGLIHIGKNAVYDRKKVLHLSLEMDEEQIGMRYYHSLFGAPKRKGMVELTQLSSDLGRLEGMERVTQRPEFTFEDGLARDEVTNRMQQNYKRFENLIIKRMPPKRLTPAGLAAFLDTLEQTEGFIPDMVILDYLGLMKVDPKNLRTSLGHTVEELRGVAVERNFALVTAHQASKEAEKSGTTDTTNVSEDWSIVGTADIVITYSCTKLEFNYGLARLYVGKARSDEDRFGLVITQSYQIGNFCLQSHYLQPRYFKLFKDMAGDEEEEDTEEYEGGGDDGS